MYYQNYEDYMKNVLGPRYTPDYENQTMDYSYNYYAPTYTMPVMNMPRPNMNTNLEYNSQLTSNDNLAQVQTANIGMEQSNNQTSEEVAKVKKMYPEIYTLLIPMIDKTLQENNEKEITEELIETMTKQIYESIEDDMSVKQVSTTSISNNIDKNRNMGMNSTAKPVANNTQVARRIGNPTLRDLIKILLINSILNNRRPNRPNHNPRPPHRPGVRPPMPRTSYPAMSYFNTPYPEDEYIG